MAETIFGDLLEPHTLIAAINDPSLDVPKQFLLTNFCGAPEPMELDKVDIYRRKGDRGLAKFIAPGKESNVVGNRNGQLLGQFSYPWISEKIPISDEDLRRAKVLDDLYRTNPVSIEERRAIIVREYIERLKARQQRREEWMFASFLTTGELQYANEENGVAFKIDLHIDSSFFPTLSGTSRWGESAANISGNIASWAKAINTATGGFGGRIIMGSKAADLFTNDPKVRADYTAINIEVGRMILNATQQGLATVGVQGLGSYRGFNPEVYQEQYQGDDGETKSYFPENGVLVVGSTFRGHRLFGLNIVDGVGYGDPYFSDSNKEWDPGVLWTRGKSRPLPLPEQEGSWVFATVCDPD